MRILGIACSTGVTLALAVAACGDSGDTPAASGAGAATKAKDYRIALVAGNLSDPYWQTFQCGAMKRAKELGATLKAYVSATSSAQEIATSFNAAVLSKPDAISYSPFQAGQFSAQVKSMMRKGVPVATSQALEPDTSYVTVRSTNDGGPYADFAIKLAGGSGKVVAMGGIAGSAPLKQRYEPLLAAIKKASPGITFLPTQYTNFDINKTAQTASSLMLAHPDLKLIIASTGPEGQGVAAAVKQAKKQGKVKVMSFDAVPAEVQALKQGTIQGLIAQTPEKIGAQQVTEVVNYLKAHPNGGPVSPVEPKQLPLKLITQDNVDDPEVQAWMYKSSCDA